MRSQTASRQVRKAHVYLVAVLAALAVLVPITQTEAQASITDDVDLRVVASGLSLAVDLAAPPGDDRLFVVEKVGRIRIIKDGTVLSTPFLDITGPVRSSENERGLLGLAFPDDYAETGLFYVHYTSDAGSGDTAIAEYQVSANPDVADATSGRILFTRDQPNSNHNGGGIHIGPDGYLYASLGDGGGGGDPGEHGQNINTTLGSIIRLDPATGDAATGNPFIDEAGADEIWVYGLRNPWRFSFDRATGDMYIGDVGQGALEEIDVAPAGVSGLNFGWDAYEGTSCFDGPCNTAGKSLPRGPIRPSLRRSVRRFRYRRLRLSRERAALVARPLLLRGLVPWRPQELPTSQWQGEAADELVEHSWRTWVHHGVRRGRVRRALHAGARERLQVHFRARA